MPRKLLFLAGAALLLLAACSNNTTSTPPAAGGSSSSSSSGSTMSGDTVQAAHDATYGAILTDAQGHTLYQFDQDHGTTSSCTASCASTWPALTVTGSATAGTGVDASLLGTAKQPNGTTQVTYNGHLLYAFSGDTAAGQTNGEGIGGIWFIMGADGNKITAASGGGASSSSAYHY
jgi:predicted lipoprotein with Yx(FWY)xxD motif